VPPLANDSRRLEGALGRAVEGPGRRRF
jgi:hypothetical protein